MTIYPVTDPNPDFVKLEQEVLAYWKEQGIFEKSVDNRDTTINGKNNKFVFYDGPPFANGLPHYGHLLTGYVKDVVARYQTMRGAKVPRNFGWDCHGLPAEMGAEKELNISGRQAITEYGIGKFNKHCETSVMKYANDWERYVDRQARWVDFEGDYKTMDTNYMESVIWAFSELHKKGLVYESYRVMPYSWAAETPLSNFETKLDNSYREKEDKAITVAFELDSRPENAPEADSYHLLAWTTTPWTLPSNLALGVHKDMEYKSVYDQKKNITIIAHKDKVSEYISMYNDDSSTLMYGSKDENMYDGDIAESCVLKGSDLIDLTYKPLFPYFTDKKDEGAFRVIDGSSFIEEGSGTGVVHLAPGFGEDDQRVCAENGIEVVCPVDGQGKFTDEVFDLDCSPLEGERVSQDAIASQVSRGGNNPLPLHTSPDGLAFSSPPSRGGQYTAKAAENAKDLRKNPTDAEVKLWNSLKSKQLNGVKFRRQQPIGNYIVDFFSSEHRLIIELDGGQHAEQQNYDDERTKYLETQGYKVLRFWNNEIFDSLSKVLENIAGICSPLEGERVSQVETAGEPWGGYTPLSLKGLNVIAQADGKCEDEPYSEAQLAKYGLVNLRIINWLKAEGKLIKQEDYKHNYPHCWRTDTPIIYKAMSSWYVAVTKFKDRAVELNKEINWIPSHIRDGSMGHMLATAPDWSISRNRFWGCPIPIWRSDNPDNNELYVFGSVAKLEDFFGVEVPDLHRPFIDELTKPDPTNPEFTLRRVSDVFDCWFESGSMPFAQLHYPFENKERFEANFPADFITEYIGQTRGWFNTLIMLSTALFDKAPFKNCICHGVVLDEETGLKYSKRLKNYKDPMEVFDKFGSDALRWMMLASPVMRGADIGVDPEGKFIRDVVRLHIKPIWNAYNFFTLYANSDEIKAEFSTQSDNLMDKYILLKTANMANDVRTAMDAYDTPSATQAITKLLESLNNWYIRRNRSRFWSSEKNADKQAAYNTLYTVLHVLVRAAAPLLPLATEAVYRGLTKEGQESVAGAIKGFSVHLQDFPAELDILLSSGDISLMQDMDRVQDICNNAHSIRNKENIRIRQPLASLTIYKDNLSKEHQDYYATLIADEANVKQVIYSDALDDVANLSLKINFPVAGKRLGAKMKSIAAAAKKGDWEKLADGSLIVAGEPMVEGEYDMALQPLKTIKAAQALSSNDAMVVFDTKITPELAAEGIARDVVRMVQQARKDAGLDISDRISLTINGSESTHTAIEYFRNYISDQVLASSLTIGNIAENSLYSTEQPLEGETVRVALDKVA